TINPDIDIVKWVKDKIKDWFGTKSIVESVAKQYIKNASEPILSYPRALLNFLESGERDRTWDKEKFHIKMKHQSYLLLEAISFIMVVIGIFLGFYGYLFNEAFIGYSGLGIIVIFVSLLNIILIFHRRMIRSKKPK